MSRATATGPRRTGWCSSPPGCGRCSTSPSATPGSTRGSARSASTRRACSPRPGCGGASRTPWPRPRGSPFADVNVDRAAYELVAFEPSCPSVIVTEGIFGDILSDIVCARAGSPALCGSATINPDRAFGRGATGLFEPAHGSSPHRTGSRRSNPTGAWLALADLLAWCPDLAALGLHARVRRALDTVLDHAAPTYDLAAPGTETIGLDEFNDLVLDALAAPHGPDPRPDTPARDTRLEAHR